MTKKEAYNNSLNYEFCPQGSSEDDGFNDASITQFDHDVLRAVARESVQNVLDARDLALGKPAIAKFRLDYIKPEDVPKHKYLAKILTSCIVASEYNPAGKLFFKNAWQHLDSHREIPVLCISDFNTVGLTGGDEDPDGNYRNFLRATGSNNKRGGTGGSFGLGKAAFVAASSFRTIFVSSRFGKGKDSGNLFQGKCRLISFELNGVKYRGIGSFGLADEKPVRDIQLIPKQYLRTENGTDIYILGLRGHKDWKDAIMKHVLHHFWRAIQKGDLEVEIEGHYFNVGNIESKIFEIFETKSVYQKTEENPIPFYQAHKNGQKIMTELPTLGKVECRIISAEGYPNQVYCLRSTGMKIEQRSFRSVVPYAGVFECDNEIGNNLLKKLEPSPCKWES